jgi:hypothetical protein
MESLGPAVTPRILLTRGGSHGPRFGVPRGGISSPSGPESSPFDGTTSRRATGDHTRGTPCDRLDMLVHALRWTDPPAPTRRTTPTPPPDPCVAPPPGA